jgi:D-alanyl-D-alanine carboxypeptidase/D-alanyl-D-alanine-endopeptidase (penicillin-binding protein 4)
VKNVARTVVAIALAIFVVAGTSRTLGASAAAAAEPPLQSVARRIVGSDQGVFVATDEGSILVALHADRLVHPASVIKVATTLVLLQRLGPAHRFDTRLVSSGPLVDGALEAPLVVEADADPVFVYENAFLALLKLHDLGIRLVKGGLVVRGPLLFNWLEDPKGRRLQQTLAGRDGAAAWRALQHARPEAATVALQQAALRFTGGSTANDSGSSRPLVVHSSPPLRRILKELNCYSNNIFNTLSEHIGGPKVVERMAAASLAPPARSAIVVTNAAGAGKGNRLSPRAAVELLQALARQTAEHELSLVDVLPVNGIDPGTLRERLPDAAHRGMIVGKTGTWGSLGASALAGAMRTRRYGQVTFAVLNRGVAVPEARRRQDAFVRALAEATDAMAWSYQRATAPAFTDARVAVFPPSSTD